MRIVSILYIKDGPGVSRIISESLKLKSYTSVRTSTLTLPPPPPQKKKTLGPIFFWVVLAYLLSCRLQCDWLTYALNW